MLLSGPMGSAAGAAYHHHHPFGSAGSAMQSMCNPWKLEHGNSFPTLGHQTVHHSSGDPHHDFLLRTAVTHW